MGPSRSVLLNAESDFSRDIKLPSLVFELPCVSEAFYELLMKVSLPILLADRKPRSQMNYVVSPCIPTIKRRAQENRCLNPRSFRSPETRCMHISADSYMTRIIL